MNDEVLLRALVRLNDAVEALEDRLPAALARPAAEGEWPRRHARLEARHAALRQSAADATDRLSRLLDPPGDR